VPRRTPPEPPWQLILEEIRSHNRTIIEAVETNRKVLEARIDQFDEASRARDGILELAIRDLTAGHRSLRDDVTALRAELKTGASALRTEVGSVKGEVGALRTEVAVVRVDVSGLSSKVDTLVGLEPRIAALERHQP
jgi:hypothetical protein